MDELTALIDAAQYNMPHDDYERFIREAIELLKQRLINDL